MQEITISDNTGPFIAKILNSKTHDVGSTISVVVKTIKGKKTKTVYKHLKNKTKQLKDGDVVKAVIVKNVTPKRTTKSFLDLRFDFGSIVLVNNKGEPLSTRIFGPVDILNLKKRKALKIIAMVEASAHI